MDDERLLKYIRQYFIYNMNGTLTRLDRKNSNGSLDKDGYLILKIKGKQYKAHRIVFALCHGRFPHGEIDHINRNRIDNRIENLREATRQENLSNTTKKVNPDTHVVGIYVDRTDGLKKRYAFNDHGKKYRFYSIREALEKRRMLNEERAKRIKQNTDESESTKVSV